MKRNNAVISVYVLLFISVCIVGYMVYTNGMRSRYDDALTCLSAGEHQKAYDIFITLGDYKDTREHLSRFEMLPIAYHHADGREGIYVYDYKSNIKGEYDVTYAFDPTYEILYGDEPVIFKESNTEYLCEYKDGLLASRTWQDELIFNYAYEFHPDGSVAKKEEKLERGPVWIFSYDTEGRLIHISHIDINGIAYEEKYFYTDGVLSHSEFIDRKDDGTTSTSTTTYECAPIYIR